MVGPQLTPQQVAAYKMAGIAVGQPAGARPASAAAIDELLLGLEQRLSTMALRVRPPSWHEPPKGAQNVRWGINDDLAGAGAGGVSSRRWGVRWNLTAEGATTGVPPGNSTLNLVDATPEPFDDGYFGVVWVRCTAGQVSTSFGAVNVMRQARWSLFHQGGGVPGFVRAMPGGNAGMRQNPTVAATFVANDHGFHDSVTIAPLIIRPNDILEVVFHTDEINVGVTVNFHCTVFGWKAPLTLLDRDVAAVRG